MDRKHESNVSLVSFIMKFDMDNCLCDPMCQPHSFEVLISYFEKIILELQSSTK